MASSEQYNPILATVRRNRARLIKRQGHVSDLMVEGYGRAVQSLSNDISRIYETAWERQIDVDNGLVLSRIRDPANLQNLTQGEAYRLIRAESLQRQIASEITRYADGADKIVYDATVREVEFAIADTRNLIGNLVPKGAKDAFVTNVWDAVNPDLGETAMMMFNYDGSALSRTLHDTLGWQTAEEIQTTMINSLLKGENPRKAARAIKDAFGLGLSRALTFARTSQLYAYRETQRQNFERNDSIVLGWTWSAALDDRTCLSCIANHGKRFNNQAILNDHHNGRCVMVPIVDLPGIGTQQIESGESWFNRQPEDRQRKLMGPGRFDLWKQKGFHFDDLRYQYDDKIYGHMIREQSLKNLRKRDWSNPSINEHEIGGQAALDARVEERIKVERRAKRSTGSGGGGTTPPPTTPPTTSPPGGRTTTTPKSPPKPDPVSGDTTGKYEEIYDLDYYDLWGGTDPKTGKPYEKAERDRLIALFNERGNDHVQRVKAAGLDLTRGTEVRQRVDAVAARSRTQMNKAKKAAEAAKQNESDLENAYRQYGRELEAKGIDSRQFFDDPEWRRRRDAWIDSMDVTSKTAGAYAKAKRTHVARVRKALYVPKKDRRYSGVDIDFDKEIDRFARRDAKDKGSDWYGVAAYKKRIRDGAEFVTRVTHADMIPVNSANRLLKPGDRPKLSYKMRLHKDGRGRRIFRDCAYTGNNEHHGTNRTSTTTAVHEAIHLVESNIFQQQAHRGVWAARTAFYENRTEGDPWERFVDAPETKTHGYEPDEKFKRDKWLDAVGSLYPGKPGNAKAYGYQVSSEIMTMGVQNLYDDPESFAQRDPEYFDFVVSWLRGAFHD